MQMNKTVFEYEPEPGSVHVCTYVSTFFGQVLRVAVAGSLQGVLPDRLYPADISTRRGDTPKFASNVQLS